MWRIIAVLIFVIVCYNFPSGYSSTHLEVGAIDENAASSLYLCMAIMLVWPSYRALWIYGIETILIIADGYMKRHMPGGGLLGNYYGTLQETAYWLEIAILLTFIVIEWRKCGNVQGFSVNRSMLNRRTDHNRSGDSN